MDTVPLGNLAAGALIGGSIEHFTALVPTKEPIVPTVATLRTAVHAAKPPIGPTVTEISPTVTPVTAKLPHGLEHFDRLAVAGARSIA